MERLIELRLALPGVKAAEAIGKKTGNRKLERLAYQARIEMAAEYAMLLEIDYG